jgi:uncharacterized phage protein (TIGR02218 family)
MSRACSVELKAHLQQSETTIATCCKVTRKDTAVYGFTTCDHDIPFEGVTYLADTGVNASEFASKAALNVDNLEIIGGLDSESITEVDLLAGLWDKASVEFFIVNYMDLTMGRLILQGGTLGEVSTTDHGFTAELRGLMQVFQENFGRAYLPTCDADYGDARCGHDPTTLTYGEVIGAVVTTPSTQRQFTASGLLADATWYDNGKVLWTLGLNTGVISEVKTHATGGVITLQLPTPYEIVADDEFTITVGCDKTATVCKVKFANKVNFRGFDKIPGASRMMSGDA